MLVKLVGVKNLVYFHKSDEIRSEYLVDEIVKKVCFEIQIDGNLPHTYMYITLNMSLKRVAGGALMISRKFSNLEK